MMKSHLLHHNTLVSGTVSEVANLLWGFWEQCAGEWTFGRFLWATHELWMLLVRVFWNWRDIQALQAAELQYTDSRGSAQ